jgi:hypothetical protein
MFFVETETLYSREDCGTETQ